MSIMFPATLIQYNGLHKHTSWKDFCALELPPSREYRSFFTSVFRETRFLKVGVPVSRPAILPEAVTRKLLLDEAKGPANFASRLAKSVASLMRALSASFCCCLSSSFFFLSSCFLSRTLCQYPFAWQRRDGLHEEERGLEPGACRYRLVARAGVSLTKSSQVVWKRPATSSLSTTWSRL